MITNRNELAVFDPNLLATFVTVAKARSFTEAGRRLGLQQSTVSQHVRRLEEAASRRLFVRDTHSVALTADGEAMLGLAQSKGQSLKSQVLNPQFNAQHPESEIKFVQGDAQCVPFPQESFDIVTVGYGLRNLASWETGLAEMTRVTKHGGRLLVLDFGKPDNAIWRGLYFGYLKLFVPLLGRLFCGDAAAYSYILQSLKQYPAQRGVAAKMRELGLDKLRTFNLLGGAMSINYAEKQGLLQAPECGSEVKR